MFVLFDFEGQPSYSLISKIGSRAQRAWLRPWCLPIIEAVFQGANTLKHPVETSETREVDINCLWWFVNTIKGNRRSIYARAKLDIVKEALREDNEEEEVPDIEIQVKSSKLMDVKYKIVVNGEINDTRTRFKLDFSWFSVCKLSECLVNSRWWFQDWWYCTGYFKNNLPTPSHLHHFSIRLPPTPTSLSSRRSSNKTGNCIFEGNFDRMVTDVADANRLTLNGTYL